MAKRPEDLPLGILGGTFDPIHLAHLRLAEEALDQLALDRVRLIPAGQPPHRQSPHSGAAHRLRMVELAAADNPRLEVDPAEVLAPVASYTVPTLERLRAELGPARPLVLLMGMDAFLRLPDWHRWEALFDLAHVAVASRPGHTFEPAAWPTALAEQWHQRQGSVANLAAAPAGRLVSFGITPLEISATAIRATLARHESPRYLLPAAVVGYIALHHLYSPAVGRCD
ncbi:nicotinate-nucleotide adenylyltransferase [Niveibacterium sp. SC-1]|uniref:nicotinate-nucleotide adenylyltransferase n=1 Tax=Niveibacterium sp. SC-1 TaxID=3135646 RepID=UPI00311F0317